MKRFTTTLLCASIALWGATNIAHAKPGDAPDDPFIVAFQGGADSLDPIMRSVTVAYSWQRGIFDTITHQLRNGDVVPRIATSWKNIEPLQWELKIRQGVKFHDGSPLTAKDVGESIMDTRNNPKSQMQVYVSSVKDYEVVDDETLLINFSAPDPVFPVHLTNVVAMPEKLIEEKGRDAFAQAPIGTGPYKLVEWQTDDYLVLEAWDGFWGDAPDFKHVRYQKIPNNSTRVSSLITGDSHVAENIAPSDFDRIEKENGLKITTNPGRRIMFLGLDYHNEENSPGIDGGGKNPFMDKRVREAVSLSIDRGLLANKIFNDAVTEAAQFLPPSSLAFNDELPAIEPNLDKAKALLAEAGYEDGFKVRFDASNDRYLYDSLVAQGIAGFLKKADLSVSVDAVPMTIFLSQRLRKGESSMYMLGWGNSNSLSTWRSVFHCKNPEEGVGDTNFIEYCNPDADALIDQAMETFDDDERNKLILEAYDIAINQDFAYIPLYYQSEIAGLKTDIEWTPRQDGIILPWEFTVKD